MDVEDIDIGLIEDGGLNHVDEGPGDHKNTEDGMATEQLQPSNDTDHLLYHLELFIHSIDLELFRD